MHLIEAFITKYLIHALNTSRIPHCQLTPLTGFLRGLINIIFGISIRLNELVQRNRVTASVTALCADSICLRISTPAVQF